MDDFLSIGVEDWGEVEWIGVLAVVHMWSIVHQSLLESNLVPESLIEANGPSWRVSMLVSSLAGWALTITVHLVHVFFRYPNQPTLLNDFWVFPGNVLNHLQIFHRDL